MYLLRGVQGLIENFEYSCHDFLKAGFTEAIGRWKSNAKVMKKVFFSLDKNEHKQKKHVIFTLLIFVNNFYNSVSDT